MKASLISIGTELLVGHTLDTNSHYLSQQLYQYGIDIVKKYTVPDHIDRIIETLKESSSQSDLMLLTGGLGPTLDDLTRDAVAQFMDLPLVLDPFSYEKIHQFFKDRNRHCTGNQIRQAYFPQNSTILENPIGTAAGFIVHHNNKRIISLPGPPKEMQLMFNNHVAPLLQNLQHKTFLTKSIQIFGLGESTVEEKLFPVTHQLPSNISLATYTSDGTITLRLTVVENHLHECHFLLSPILCQINQILGDYIYSFEGETLEEVVCKLLIEKKQTLSIAESCTGGLLSSKITSVPGISSSFDRSYITYSNQSKIKELDVPENILQQCGAVSKETALAMVKGVKNKTGSDCCISITGIAGPNGGTKEKPVGLVFIGVNIQDQYDVFKFIIKGNRDIIQNKTALTALNLLRKGLINL